MLPSLQISAARVANRGHDGREQMNLSQYYSYRDSQRQQLVSLIEHLYHQIRYGCSEPTCCIPTCRTCRDRLAKTVPYRVPTPLTARAIASYVASLDDPYRHLCPHPPTPKSDAHDLAFATSKVLGRLESTKEQGLTALKANLEYWLSTDPGLAKVVDTVVKEESQREQGWSTRDFAQNQGCDGVGLNSNLSKSSGQNALVEAPIDSKAFAQKLYSTVTWKLGSFIEVHEGKYRVLPPWTAEVFSFVSKISVEPNPMNPSGHSRNSRAPNVVYANIHPQIGIFSYPLSVRTEKHKPPPIAFTPFGEVVCGLCRRNPQSKMFRDLDRTCPVGSESFLSKEDIAGKRQAMLRLVSNVLSTPSKIRKYGLYPPLPTSAAGTHSFTAPLLLLVQEFGMLSLLEQHPQTIFNSLAISVQATYLKGESIDQPKTMPEMEAAHMINIALVALIASVFKETKEPRAESWKEFVRCRRAGHFLSSVSEDPIVRKASVELMAAYQNEHALYLMRLVLRCVASRFYRIERRPEMFSGLGVQYMGVLSAFYRAILRFLRPDNQSQQIRHSLYARILLEWARSIFLQEWNGKAELSWSSDVGCAVEFMRFLYDQRVPLGLHEEEFGMSVLFDKTDFIEISKAWTVFKPSAEKFHLLSFPWLFNASAVVTFFRAINFSIMFKSFEKSIMMSGLINRMTPYVNGSQQRLFDRLQVSTTTFLVLEIRRDNILRDALNQLWRRQKRELLRPLKVRMGMDEGEEGFDLGGVQQEFFRLAIAEALDPVHGLFTVDEASRMTWFLPNSSAPLHHYVLIGLLFGLAIYNGLTLPVTFPTALYRKLLGRSVSKLQHIKDGWPGLSKGLEELLRFDGSVEDVFMRQYVFSFDSQGETFNVDMQNHQRKDPWPPADVFASHNETVSKNRLDTIPGDTRSRKTTFDSAPSVQELWGRGNADAQEAGMVTNENRERYVEDYIYWLTDKSIAPQYSAFATGFYLPLQKKSLLLFTPRSFQSLVEGIQEIDIDGLERATEYEDGYHSQHPTIVDFWKIVREFSLGEKRLLLEFVTASDRIPVRGVDEMTFIVQRNGVGDERLPSSATCFGRLLLPEYSRRELMEQKLRTAINNSRGFGYQ